MLNRIKRINSHTGHARFLAECEDTEIEIERQVDIPRPYAYSPRHVVYAWNGRLVIIVETMHRRFDVFDIGATPQLAPEQF